MFQKPTKYKTSFLHKSIIGTATMGFLGILLPNNVTAMPTEPERPDCEDT